MGVPAFYRWLTSRYPKTVVVCEEEEPIEIDGVTVPVDLTKPSPNGEVDNLYLDMNGIIHPCFHPEDSTPPLTFEECFQAIFVYIDRILSIVRPRKLLFMAIDGVAPRAKMNQQRGRRFKSAKESQEKLQEEARIRGELRREGLRVKETNMVSEVTQLSDSNIITPGTAFMAKLSVALQYYIHLRLNNEPGWKNLVVILSDANVPGEGEHKIMEYIRQQRGRAGWNPNLTHVVSGLDADLIHLALATHEPQFHILREVVYGPKAGDSLESGAKPKVPYQYLKISILREYLAVEFFGVTLPFQFDKERIYDDFVFLCFFVGNDFLPHSPTLEIREGGIDLLMQIYKRQLPSLGGWLCEGSKVDLKRVEVIIKEVAKCEEQILAKRVRQIKNQKSRRKQSGKRPLRVEVTSPSTNFARNHHENPKGTPKKQKIVQDGIAGSKPILESKPKPPDSAVNASEIWNSLLATPEDAKAEFINTDEIEMEDSSIEEMVQRRLKESSYEKADKFDSMVEHSESVGFGTSGWKDRYYRMKFPEASDQERRGTIKDMTEKFVEGLLWVMAYYYDGVASWTWYYPYHYAPFASDLKEISSIQPNFQIGQPFLPINQLMAVLPAASRFCLPECLQPLFVEKDSPILDFYPSDFKCDMNGKRFAWQAVVLLPFIDEKRLIQTTEKYVDQFTEEEKQRNQTKLTQFYIGELHPMYPFVKEKGTQNKNLTPEESLAAQLQLNPEWSDGIHGFLCVAGDTCPESLQAPYGLGEDISRNRVCFTSFLNPDRQIHQCQLMEGAQEQLEGLMKNDIPPDAQPWHQHERHGHDVSGSFHQQPRFSIDRGAARRFIEHGINAPKIKEDGETVGSRIFNTPLRASAPEFVPDFVTQKALQMTGHYAGPGFHAAPLVPPDYVTDAAIKMAERVQLNQRKSSELMSHRSYPTMDRGMHGPQPPPFPEALPPPFPEAFPQSFPTAFPQNLHPGFFQNPGTLFGSGETLFGSDGGNQRAAMHLQRRDRGDEKQTSQRTQQIKPPGGSKDDRKRHSRK